MEVPTEARRVLDDPASQVVVTEGCELPDMGVGNRTLVLCKGC